MQRQSIESIPPPMIGRRLQEARKARGLTQQDVADVLEVARTTVTALEKGERRTRPDELIKMARLFGRPVGDFVVCAIRFTNGGGRLSVDQGVDAAALDALSRNEVFTLSCCLRSRGPFGH